MELQTFTMKNKIYRSGRNDGLRHTQVKQSGRVGWAPSGHDDGANQLMRQSALVTQAKKLQAMINQGLQMQQSASSGGQVVQRDVNAASIYCAHADLYHDWKFTVDSFLNVLKRLGPNHIHYSGLKNALKSGFHSKMQQEIEKELSQFFKKQNTTNNSNNSYSGISHSPHRDLITYNNSNKQSNQSLDLTNEEQFNNHFQLNDYDEDLDDSYNIYDEEPNFNQKRYKGPKFKPKKFSQNINTYNSFKPKKYKEPKNKSDLLKQRDKLKKNKKGYLQRPGKYGQVNVKMEQINHVSGKNINRPKEVSGLVFPMTTKGRPNAPEPSSGYRVGVQWKEVDKRIQRNTGVIDAQKGHIMALELGGPDEAFNIVPQWANWQANGAWRQMEKDILSLAKVVEKRGNTLFFRAEILYKKYKYTNQGSIKGISFPTGFRVEVQEKMNNGKAVGQAQLMWNGEQQQDKTDLKVAWKVMDSLDQYEFTDNTNNNSNSSHNNNNSKSSNTNSKMDTSF